MQLLPPFKGYLVDAALQRFRTMPSRKGEPSAYIAFASPSDEKMLREYVAVYTNVMRGVAKLAKKHTAG